MTTTRSTLTHLSCSRCGEEYNADKLMNLCPACEKPLLARYDLAKAARTLTRESLQERESSLWRYEEVLPVRTRAAQLKLGEGWTPLICAQALGREIGCPHTLIKDESLNPTGSFKARGLVMAVGRAYELGAKELAIPSAGNAAGAMSAYAAKAGLRAHVYMPEDVPAPFRVECSNLGAQVTLVDGLITDCGARVREKVEQFGWFDVSTLKEPYRIEGKKTLGYEVVEQLGWRMPDVIVYRPAGAPGWWECGRRLTRWNRWDWSAANDHAWSVFRVAAARRWCGHSSWAKSLPSRGRARRRLPTACEFRQRSAIS